LSFIQRASGHWFSSHLAFRRDRRRHNGAATAMCDNSLGQLHANHGPKEAR
jgi:hypothetical protein